MADLGRWLGGEYRLAGPPADGGTTDAEPAVNRGAPAPEDRPDDDL